MELFLAFNPNSDILIIVFLNNINIESSYFLFSLENYLWAFDKCKISFENYFGHSAVTSDFYRCAHLWVIDFQTHIDWNSLVHGNRPWFLRSRFQFQRLQLLFQCGNLLLQELLCFGLVLLVVIFHRLHVILHQSDSAILCTRNEKLFFMWIHCADILLFCRLTAQKRTIMVPHFDGCVFENEERKIFHLNNQIYSVFGSLVYFPNLLYLFFWDFKMEDLSWCQPNKESILFFFVVLFNGQRRRLRFELSEFFVFVTNYLVAVLQNDEVMFRELISHCEWVVDFGLKHMRMSILCPCGTRTLPALFVRELGSSQNELVQKIPRKNPKRITDHMDLFDSVCCNVGVEVEDLFAVWSRSRNVHAIGEEDQIVTDIETWNVSSFRNFETIFHLFRFHVEEADFSGSGHHHELLLLLLQDCEAVSVECRSFEDALFLKTEVLHFKIQFSQLQWNRNEITMTVVVIIVYK